VGDNGLLINIVETRQIEKTANGAKSPGLMEKLFNLLVMRLFL